MRSPPPPQLSQLPSASSWNDQIEAGKGNPLLLKIFALSPCGKKRVPITPNDWEGQLQNKWTDMVMKALEAANEAKSAGLPPLPKPRFYYIKVIHIAILVHRCFYIYIFFIKLVF